MHVTLRWSAHAKVRHQDLESPNPAVWLGYRERSVKGHEDQFLPLRLSARSVIRKQTVAATRGNGRDAPIPDLPALAQKRGGSIQSERMPIERSRKRTREASTAC